MPYNLKYFYEKSSTFFSLFAKGPAGVGPSLVWESDGVSH